MEKLRIPKRDRHIIDAVENLSFKNQTQQYNEDFKVWRNNKKNPYVYRFTKNTKEHIYIDGVGFIDKKPQVNEEKAFSKYMLLLGFILSGMYFTSIIIKLLCGSGLKYLYNNFSDISTVVSTNIINTIFAIIYCMVELAVPVLGMIIMLKFLKIPKSVAFPTETSDKFIQFSAIPIILSVIVVATICSYAYKQVIHLLGIEPERITYYVPEHPMVLITTAFIYIILGAVFYESLIHGVIMQSLRQFGDGFALVTVSIIAACIPHNLSNICYLFIISIAIGYFVLRTGSIKTGIYMQIIYRTYMYAYSVIKNTFESQISTNIIIWINLLFLIVGTLAIIISTRKVNSLLSFDFQKTFMTAKEKFFHFITCPTILLWLVITFIWLVVSIKIRI